MNGCQLESEISIDAMVLQRGGVHCPMATAELKLLGTLVLIMVTLVLIMVWFGC